MYAPSHAADEATRRRQGNKEHTKKRKLFYRFPELGKMRWKEEREEASRDERAGYQSGGARRTGLGL